ncbi:MAG: hypothetical protein ACLQOO_29195 [Terriglobia bacterium]
MDRRNFLKESLEKGTMLAAGLVASGKLLAAPPEKTPTKTVARRPLGKTGEHLSILGVGGIVVMSVEQSSANNIVAEAVDRGINYFDVSPDYGDAEERLGPAPALPQPVVPGVQNQLPRQSRSHGRSR